MHKLLALVLKLAYLGDTTSVEFLFATGHIFHGVHALIADGFGEHWDFANSWADFNVILVLASIYELVRLLVTCFHGQE